MRSLILQEFAFFYPLNPLSRGDAVPQEFIPKLIKLYQAGQFPFDRLLKFYDFGDINRAMADSKRGDTIKPVLRISEV